MMSHAAVGVTGMQDPFKRFGEIIAGIKNPRMMLHDEIFLLTPFLGGKILDVDVLSMGSGAFLIDHMESCHVINEKMCQARSKSIKRYENAAKILSNLSHKSQTSKTLLQ